MHRYNASAPDKYRRYVKALFMCLLPGLPAFKTVQLVYDQAVVRIRFRLPVFSVESYKGILFIALRPDSSVFGSIYDKVRDVPYKPCCGQAH